MYIERNYEPGQPLASKVSEAPTSTVFLFAVGCVIAAAFVLAVVAAATYGWLPTVEQGNAPASIG